MRRGEKGQDELENLAGEIATQHFLKGKKLKELAGQYSSSAPTIHRRLNKWLQEDRFELVDRLSRKNRARVLELDETLGEMLARRTKIWRSRVARIAGAEAAHTDDYLETGTVAAQRAYEAGDELHKALGEVAGELLLNILRRNMTVGWASGRGVGFTVIKLAELVEKRPAWVKGYESLRLVSLCGGARVGTWSIAVHRDLDANANVLQLANVLRIPQENRFLMPDQLSSYPQQPELDSPHHHNLDLAIVGLGQLNTQHHFYQYLEAPQLQAIAEPLRVIRDCQSKNHHLLYKVAEIGHRLFVVGEKGGLPSQFLEAIDAINYSVVAISPESIKKASEIVLVAGGSQKVQALFEVITGACPEAPVDLTNLTLVTDSETAHGIVSMIESNRK